jgi:hydroxymethylglutaryl-CoA lyase
MNNHVRMIEVGPRDGLQNESNAIPTSVKLQLIQRLADCGLPVVEITSFVSPKWVPQLADAEELMSALQRNPETRYPVLVPNLKGLERAVSSGSEDIAVFAAASESFSLKNTNCTIAESLTRLKPVLARARKLGLRTRGYVSCVLGCPYEGHIKHASVTQISAQLTEMGCDEISLGDTIGTGTPGQAKNLLRSVMTEVAVERLAVHFHDTYGQALANILACLELGIRKVDASVAGLGGCPYARGASGNVATEDVIYMLHGLGMKTGVDLDCLAQTGEWISAQLERPNNSRAGAAIVKSIEFRQLMKGETKRS